MLDTVRAHDHAFINGLLADSDSSAFQDALKIADLAENTFKPQALTREEKMSPVALIVPKCERYSILRCRGFCSLLILTAPQPRT
jgi:hypothetical protein